MHEHRLWEASGAAPGGHGGHGVRGVWDQRRESHQAPRQPRPWRHGTRALACWAGILGAGKRGTGSLDGVQFIPTAQGGAAVWTDGRAEVVALR